MENPTKYEENPQVFMATIQEAPTRQLPLTATFRTTAVEETNPSMPVAPIAETHNLKSPDQATAISAAKDITSIISSAAQYLIGIGNYTTARNMLQKTINDIQASSVVSNTDVQAYITSLTSLLDTVTYLMPPPSGAQPAASPPSVAQPDASSPSGAQPGASSPSGAQPQASRAIVTQGYFSKALASTNMHTSVKAAMDLDKAVRNTVDFLMTTGSFALASTLINEAITSMITSGAGKQNKRIIGTLVTKLKILLQSVNSLNPEISPDQLVSTRDKFIKQLQHADVKVSSDAVKSVSNLTQDAANNLVIAGSKVTATALLNETLRVIQSSTAYNNNEPEAILRAKTIVNMLFTLHKSPPPFPEKQIGGGKKKGRMGKYTQKARHI